MIKVGSLVQVKEYPDWGFFRVVGYNPRTDKWQLSYLPEEYSDGSLIYIRD